MRYTYISVNHNKIENDGNPEHMLNKFRMKDFGVINIIKQFLPHTYVWVELIYQIIMTSFRLCPTQNTLRGHPPHPPGNYHRMLDEYFFFELSFC